MAKEIQFRRTTAILTLVAASLGGGVIAALMVSARTGAPLIPAADAAGYSAVAPVSSYADMIEKVTPAVVSVYSTTIVKQQMNPMFADPFFRQFFGQQFGQQMQPRDQKEHSLGSGVIINSDGYIVTNNHVVDGAKDVKVLLLDHREFTAKVVGKDKGTDIAVLKIDAKDLPTVQMGDSKNARIGDICFAIGNPFGVGQTVTMGIVSAKSRSLRGTIENFEDFIQTDAAINPGNSGGALVNSNGQLIGINTAILANGSEGNQGIGFAIPVNLARNIMNQIVKTGKVTRGFMGATLQPVTSDLEKQFGLSSANGALVTSVEPGKPAAEAGLKVGDVITKLNGQPVLDANDIVISIIQMTPGSVAHLEVVRNGQHMNIDVTLGTRPSDTEASNSFSSQNSGNASNALNGVAVENVTPEIAQQLHLSGSLKGVVVDSVDDDSPAADAGLQRGDVIVQVNRQPVTDEKDYNRLMQAANGKSILLLVNRNGGNIFMVVQSK